MRPSGHTMLRRCPVPCGVPLQLSVRHSHGVAGSPAGSASDVNPLISSVRPRSATSLGTASTSSVDVATPPDTLVVQMPRVPGCSQSERTINRSTFLTELQTCCETVRAEAVQNDMRHAKAIALDSDYLEELPKLYTNEPLNLEKHVACSSRFGNGCTMKRCCKSLLLHHGFVHVHVHYLIMKMSLILRDGNHAGCATCSLAGETCTHQTAANRAVLPVYTFAFYPMCLVCMCAWRRGQALAQQSSGTKCSSSTPPMPSS
eukprot:m.1547088 g.1547088  ORF g.1547088 m.1547088 type:complete len:260 (-) comp25260_c0_seq98:3413-4192(-)